MIDNCKITDGEQLRRVSDRREFSVAIRPHKGWCCLIPRGEERIVSIRTKVLRADFERVKQKMTLGETRDPCGAGGW